MNDRDQFLAPTKPLPATFVNDCLLWMLFNTSNLTASARSLEWNNRKWSLVNHFVPFTEDEVGAPSAFESDFMVQHLASKKLSKEASAVLAEGRRLWNSYFDHVDAHSTKKQWHLDRPDVGWYQIRNVLKERNASGDYAPVNFEPLERAYSELTDKIRPDVYTHGFLPIDE